MVIAVIDRYPILSIGVRQLIKSNFDHVSIMEAGSIALFREAYPKCFPSIIMIGGKQFDAMDDLRNINLCRTWYPKGNVIVYYENKVENLSGV